MKKLPGRNGLEEPARKSRLQNRASKKKTGRWAFNLATESLYALQSGEAVLRVAYRKPNGELRYLPH
jgi:hypothetical protein